MSKITSKLQVTVPKALANMYHIHPGDEVKFEAAGEVIRILPSQALNKDEGLDIDARLRLFDAATERQRNRQAKLGGEPTTTRGWTREEFYERGFPTPD